MSSSVLMLPTTQEDPCSLSCVFMHLYNKHLQGARFQTRHLNYGGELGVDSGLEDLTIY